MRITDVKAQVLAVRWVDYFGGESNVPHHLFHPSANFISGRRREGQFTVLVTVETDEGITGLGEAWGLRLLEGRGLGHELDQAVRGRVFRC